MSISCFTGHLNNNLNTKLSVVSGAKNVSAGASSRDGQAAQDTSFQQLQQGDTVETFRKKYLSSGKFNFNKTNFLDACLRAARIHS